MGVPVAVRYPADIALYYKDHPNVTFHNDCILAQGVGKADEGTFDRASPFWTELEIGKAQAFAKKVKGPKGGESCDAGH